MSRLRTDAISNVLTLAGFVCSLVASVYRLLQVGREASRQRNGVDPGAAASTDAPKEALKPISLLNVSYDPTREFYQEFNASFAKLWKAEHNQEVTVEQSHGGSGKQAAAIIDGLEADVATLALGLDLDMISEKSKLFPADWQKAFPNNSSPYTSTIVFLVRKGNPKQIKDWDDLLKPGIEIITPNPKTSGGAKLNYLAAWGYATVKELGGLANVKTADADKLKAANEQGRKFVEALIAKVPVLDSGARGATNTFIQREIGDVLLTWENEAFLALKDSSGGNVEVVVPSLSILAEPPVAVIEEVAKKHGTVEVAKAYLQHLYSPEGQQLAAKHYFRPVMQEHISEEQKNQFAKVELFRIGDLFGSWAEAQKAHFDDGASFDQLYQPK